MPRFARFPLSAITPQEVDRYKVDKARERQELEAARARGEKVGRGLSNNSVNHTLSDLAQVLETAVEYGLIAANPASGKRRRLKSTRPSRPWVEPEQLMALLDGATGTGRVLLGLLAGAGLRIGERSRCGGSTSTLRPARFAWFTRRRTPASARSTSHPRSARS